jgi:hypothetical protein
LETLFEITKNFKGFKNNGLHKVTGISDRGLELDNREIGDGMYHIDQGIAVTSHAAQGKTVDQVVVSAPVESFAQVSREQFYVSMSRARQAMHLVTDNKSALRAAVTRTSQRLSPWELGNGIEKEVIKRNVGQVDLQVGKQETKKQRTIKLSPLEMALHKAAQCSSRSHTKYDPPEKSREQERGHSYER